MVDEPKDATPAETPPRLLQFSLFSIFVVTIAVAVACSLTFTMPAVVALPLLAFFSLTLAGVLITVIVYGRTYQRTFCIGAVVPFGVLLISLAFMVILFLDGPSGWTQSLTSRLVIVGFWASSILVGATCVGVRRLIEKRESTLDRAADE